MNGEMPKGTSKTPDQLDAAIASAAEPQRMVQSAFGFKRGDTGEERQVVILLPEDLREGDCVAVFEGVLQAVRGVSLAAEQKAHGGLVLARAPLPKA